jgi:hypothetical protein
MASFEQEYDAIMPRLSTLPPNSAALSLSLSLLLPLVDHVTTEHEEGQTRTGAGRAEYGLGDGQVEERNKLRN